MSFVDTTRNPPEKGQFEYKPKYEKLRIFSLSNISKYSSKIKNICENIVKYSKNGDVENISKGVILIYSQYIDGGLIPVALALEELGFTRYGQNVKNLFKNKPTEPIDVRTMKPREKNTRDFMPARYIMITGDPRLSPNNAFEVKGATGEDNKDGNKIKVVLISQAGSEGIDLKFLRQVHILEPWYNMNRIEQIVGRAVRNFSHKDLPFEERNVEIFMHATLLKDKKEEAADLYVYRVAEEKAIQIGRVTRLLKETSVDCILNYEQSNFTQKNFEKILNQKHETVKQVLSNGKVINDFKIGDVPFSSACDYMKDCEYKCKPFKQITDADINEETYDESFIIVNSEKLMQKIRSLFSDKQEGKFFFKKDDLIRQVRGIKNYPLVQIYSVLTQLVNDTTEFIVDRYGRNGRLVNVGDYYLFQPNELDNKNISVFERSVPIDYKIDKIRFEIKDTGEKEDILKNIEKGKEEEKQITKEVGIKQKGKEIFNEMLEKFNVTKQFTKQTSVPRGDKSENIWYKHCGITIRKMVNDKVPVEDLLEFLIQHIVDMLVYREKVDVLNYLYSLKVLPENSFEERCLDYFNSKIIKVKKLTAIEFYDVKKRVIFILDQKSNVWNEAEPEDELVVNKLINERPVPSNFNNLIGFIDYEVKTGNFMVFKVKDLMEKRHTGARCDGAGKKDTIMLLNRIIGEEKYNKENTKGMIQEELCSLQEFTLRYYNKLRKNDKIYFLDTSSAKNYGF